MASPSPPSTCFTCTRLNSTTFVIVEDDIFSEQPLIYAKLLPTALVLFDTGCGGAARDPTVQLRSLRTFLETYPVADNNSQPLNPHGAKPYAVICTHCHYDHIGGIEEFSARSAQIYASAHDKAFLDPSNLPSSSLCRFLGIPTPRYQITHWVLDATALPLDGESEMVAFHTPGHTPDSLAVYDAGERVLFVGDTLYEWAPIIFPQHGGGAMGAYRETLARLRGLVEEWNNDGQANGNMRRVTLACGHITRDADAEEFLAAVEGFLKRVLNGEVVGREVDGDGGVTLVLYESEDGRVSFRGPKELFKRPL